MKQPFPVFLIDLDSVLIEPRGYRLSVQAALRFFTERMGLGDLYPGEEAIERFEAINMTCEWDITPILLASIFEGLLRENPGMQLPSGILESCDYVAEKKLTPPKLLLTPVIKVLARHFQPGVEYATLALDLSQPNSPDAPFALLAGHPLLTAILAGTRLMEGALTTRVFQHFTLGAERFEHFTGQSRLFNSESLLETHDQVLLGSQTRQTLLQHWRGQKIGACVYTARPSLPVKGDVKTYNYSPEAEVALKALKLEDLPLVAAGKMGWLALQTGKRVDQLTKPSPVQALAAIGTAVTRQIEPALWAASELYFENHANGFWRLPELSIHVFEDAGGNINAVRKAAELLATAGLPNRVTAWGIASNPLKKEALLKVGATLVEKVDQAIERAFQIEGIS